MKKWARIGCSGLAVVAVAAGIGIAAMRMPPEAVTPFPVPEVQAPAGAPNILLLTVDDMNWDSSGVYGSTLAGITPNIDRLASEGALFEQAFVTSPICQPSRSAWMTGRFPPSSGAVGFLPINAGVPTLPETMRNAGWRIGILAKNTHTPPLDARAWDYWIEPRELGVGRDPEAFYRHTRQFIADSRKTGRPFFLNVNIQDPHRPFPGGKRAWWGNILDFLAPQGDFPPTPKPFISPADVPVPGYLPDLPEVREELAQYYTAVHRADRSVGRVMDALRESGLDGNTIVVFASDNGMAFPFAKQTLYDAGLRTQMIVRWPGNVAKGQRIADFAPTGVDVMPTLLEAAGLKSPSGMNGRSFLGRLTGGQAVPGHGVAVIGYVDRVDIALPVVPRQVLAYPSRSITTGRHIYIWNGWSDGTTEFLSEAQTGLTYPAMRNAARGDKKIAGRVDFYLKRTTEELYDRIDDPNALQNLVHKAGSQDVLKDARSKMLAHLVATNDPQLPVYREYLSRMK